MPKKPLIILLAATALALAFAPSATAQPELRAEPSGGPHCSVEATHDITQNIEADTNPVRIAASLTYTHITLKTDCGL